MKRRHLLGLATSGALLHLSGCKRGPKLDTQAYQGDILAVIKQHAEVCSSAYRIAWQKADVLRGKVQVFLAESDSKNHAAVRKAWIDAFMAYMETEGLRGFGTPADSLHRQIEAWPIDPSKIDSVPGNVQTGLVHDRTGMTQLTLSGILQQHQPSTGNVLTGFHALEFLIFGVDQYDDGNGSRTFMDYVKIMGFERRRELLEILANLLSADIQKLFDAWHPSEQGNYRAQFMAKSPEEALKVLFTGLVSVCGDGLGGKLSRALASGDQKDEVCNFSDTSLDAIRHAITGRKNVLKGKAPGRVAEQDEKPILALIAKADTSLATEIESGFAAMASELQSLSQPFDQLIKKGNTAGRNTLEGVLDSLKKQQDLLVIAANALGAKVTSSA
ncbi:MAG: imelysin family protein [Verrucomicrobiales bacterium]